MTNIMIKVGDESAESYIGALKQVDPSLNILEWPDYGNPDEIDVAMVWKLPHGELRKFPNLKLVISMAAGVDHVLSDPHYPKDIPLVRVTDPHMARSMAHWFIMNILQLHRETNYYNSLRRKKIWESDRAFDTDSICVGIMGLGYLGVHLATMLLNIGLRVQGWSRTSKKLKGIRSFTGDDGLAEMLKTTNYLACLLPDTSATKGILDRSLFEKMPKGSFLLNAGRGNQLVEKDLTMALDNGQIKGAALDVFIEEPLPKNHPFWDDHRIIITPHHAAEVFMSSAANAFVENIRRVRSGQPLKGLVNQEVGY